MNCQKKPPKEVTDLLNKNKVRYIELDYYAFPQLFSSTSGPYFGVSGQAMTTFTVEAFVCDGVGPTVYTCAGRHKFDDNRFDLSKKPTW